MNDRRRQDRAGAPGGAGDGRPNVHTGGGDGLPRQAVALRPFNVADASRLEEIDRTESVPMLYAVRDGEVVPTGRGCEVPQWHGAWLEETVAFARRHLQAGGVGIGAYDGERLAGVGVLGGEAVGGDPELLQLALLHVGRPYRRAGIAARLLDEIRGEATRRGGRRLYISATPSQSALGFYTAQGAVLATPPDPELLALEPEDVHLVLDLRGSS